MAVLFTVCLTVSNLFASKLFLVGGFTLSGAVILFPVTYVLNDIFVEVYGFRKARLVIWTGFAVNLFIALVAQLEILLPGAPFWGGQEGFRMVFGSSVRSLTASLSAFVVGSTVNAFVVSRMKIRHHGKNFPLRAIVSSLLGEACDSLIFVSIMFWAYGLRQMVIIVLSQIIIKVTYEIVVLPLTMLLVRKLKDRELEEAFDEGISYNPFRIFDI